MVKAEAPISTAESKAQQAVWWAGNVAMRFEVYDYAEPKFDIYQAVYERLGLGGRELIVDVGSYDGSFLFLLRKHKHKGDLIGIEPEIETTMPSRPHNKLRFYGTLANNLPGGDQTVDILTSNFMMYFGTDQEANLSEFIRVLKPDGKLVVTTSGYMNKARHRQFEQLIAQTFSVEPPAMMNKNFDTDKAAEMLPQSFMHVYHGSYSGRMVFRSQVDALAYYHSMLSMAKFFDPPLTEDQMHEGYINLVAPIIDRDIELLGSFEDYIQRDLFICSNDPYSLWMHDPKSSSRVNIMGYHKEELGAPELLD